MESSNEKMIYFITGASGVGKTTLVSALREKFSHMQWAFLHFDSIGVPSESEMKKEFDSGSGWQEAKTYEWIDTIIGSFDHNKIFLEVQVNLEFIQKGFQKHNFTNYKIILVECSEKEMTHRLINNRKQPELFNNNMRNWLKYLRTRQKDLERSLSTQAIYQMPTCCITLRKRSSCEESG